MGSRRPQLPHDLPLIERLLLRPDDLIGLVPLPGEEDRIAGAGQLEREGDGVAAVRAAGGGAWPRRALLFLPEPLPRPPCRGVPCVAPHPRHPQGCAEEQAAEEGRRRPAPPRGRTTGEAGAGAAAPPGGGGAAPPAPAEPPPPVAARQALPRRIVRVHHLEPVRREVAREL